MTKYALAALQERRGGALDAGDMAAYWAFDILIAHVLGTVDFYASENIALKRCREHEAGKASA